MSFISEQVGKCVLLDFTSKSYTKNSRKISCAEGMIYFINNTKDMLPSNTANTSGIMARKNTVMLVQPPPHTLQ